MYQLELETKHVMDSKREKAYNRCQAREKLQAVPSAGKRTGGAKSIHDCFFFLFFGMIGLITCHSSDWLKHVQLNFCYSNVCYFVPFKNKRSFRVRDHAGNGA